MKKNVTANEMSLIQKLVDHNEYGEKGNLDNTPWSWAVCGTKSLGAVLGSLVSKGLAHQQGKGNDATCSLTDEGKLAYLDNFGYTGIFINSIPESRLASLPKVGGKSFDTDEYGRVTNLRSAAEVAVAEKAAPPAPAKPSQLDIVQKRIADLQERLLHDLSEVERIVASMKKDATGNFHPRYHGHLVAAVLQANETAIRIQATDY